MNQILNDFNNNENISFNLSSKNKFKNIFIISLIMLIIAIFAYFIMRYNYIKNENISKNIVSNFSIKTLYSNETDYTASFIATEDYNNEPFVIGLIEIEKINITYPILSTTTDELLKISPCRFLGPMPNEVREPLYCWP
jgi:sortase (surface protein transpeptidase)